MKFKDPSTGKVYATIGQAIDAFRCPGPCTPDCPLYGSVKLSGDKWAHKCHPDWAAAHPAQVASLIDFAMLEDDRRPSKPHKNAEGYADPTAYHALKPIMQEDAALEGKVSFLIKVLKYIIEESGFELLARIELRDKRTGRCFR